MSALRLFSFVGKDNPSALPKILAEMANLTSKILDVDHSVTLDQLQLAIVALHDDSKNLDSLVKTCLGMSIAVNTSELASADYENWVAEAGRPKFVVTVLASEITAQQLSQVCVVLQGHNLSVENMQRLSGRISLQEPAADAFESLEILASGDVSDLATLRSDLLSLASEQAIDIAVQAEDIYRRTRKLVCFDMDSTLIKVEVIDELAKAAGVGEQVAAITEAAMRGELDFNESFANRLGTLKGLDESVLAEIAANLPITEGAERLVSTLKKMGYKTAILSGGFNYFARYLQQKMGFDYVYANELEIENGKVTGRVVGEVVNGERKEFLLRQIAQQEGILPEQVIAVGDGANDIPMLSAAGLGVAFRAKPIVREKAKQSISTLGLDAILYLIGYRD
ncbi:phosphoserine phosphatase SerB [Sessilibacter sp. MAH4]